jgi:hypothetical protein
MCLLAMLAELWSGMEPMHLFYALDFHAYIVFNFMAAAMFVIYWGALLINAVIARWAEPLTLTLNPKPSGVYWGGLLVNAYVAGWA